MFFGGVLLSITRAATGKPFWGLGLPLLLLYALGSLKAWWRWQAVRLVLPVSERRGIWSQILLWPLTALLFAANALVAAWSQRIVWRGVEYDLKRLER